MASTLSSSSMSLNIPIVPPIEPTSPVLEGGIPQDELRAVWDEAWGPLSPTRHDKTAVLMLSWHERENDDDLVVGEKSRLAKIFRDTYGFTVYEELLSTKDSSPQLQAREYLATFARKEDHKRGLLIVYYAGHASWKEAERGKIFLCGQWPTESIDKEAVVDWMDAEWNLTDTKADVLVIFDCCHAGLLCKPAWRGPRRCFEYLVATSESGRTRVAGKKSFTTALTWALEKLASREGFHTTDLVGQIKKAPEFPEGQYPHVYGCRFDPCAEHIYIAPMHTRGDGDASPIGQYRDEQQSDFIVDLRLHLSQETNTKAVKKFDPVKKFAKQLKGLIDGGHLECSRVQLLDRNFRLAEWTTKLWKAKPGAALFVRKQRSTIVGEVQGLQAPVLGTDGLSELSTLSSTSADEKPMLSPGISKPSKRPRRSQRNQKT